MFYNFDFRDYSIEDGLGGLLFIYVIIIIDIFVYIVINNNIVYIYMYIIWLIRCFNINIYIINNWDNYWTLHKQTYKQKWMTN